MVLHNQRPSYTVILGGTNDLGSKESAVDILVGALLFCKRKMIRSHQYIFV